MECVLPPGEGAAVADRSGKHENGCMNYLSSFTHSLGCGLAIFLLFACPAPSPAAIPQSVYLQGSVVDEAGSPAVGFEVKIQSISGETQFTQTNMAGGFEFSLDKPGKYRLSLNKAGFFRLSDQALELTEGKNEVFLTVYHETEIHDEVEVYSSAESIQPLVTSHGNSLIAREIRDIPVRSTHDLRNSLQTLPEVVRDNSGELHIAGGRTAETQYTLDGFDIGDPVTGNLSVRVNVDSVRVAEVESGRFGAQYGSAGAAVLALDTNVGDDRWRAGANNFLPGIRIQRGFHLASWYPRFTLSGPLRKQRAWFSEALSLQYSKSLVEDLPREEDSTSQWAGDNLFRTQINLTPKNILQANFLYNQQKASNLGLGPLAPISTTRNLRAYRSFFSVKDQVWSNRSFYEFGFAADFGHGETLPHGFEPYVVTPNGVTGNHFESLREKTRRWQAFASITLPSRQWHGLHNLQFGLNASEIGWTHSAERTVIQVLRADNTPVQHTVFSGSPEFHLTNASLGLYAQDSWHIHKAFVLQFDLRTDWNRIVQRVTPSPRISANFLPFEHNRTKFTAAWGIYLQPVTLSALGPIYDQHRIDTFFGRSGDSPIFGPVLSRFVLPDEPLKQPRFHTISVGWEQYLGLGRDTQIGLNFTQRSGYYGLAYEKADSPISENIFVLQNNRKDRYRAVQASFRHSFTDKAAISCNYTRSSARTNQVFDYSLGTIVFAPQESGPLGWDAPNRFLSSGWTPIPFWDLFLSYFFEYRTGFPFSIVNEQHQLVGPANSYRFPNYLDLNLGIEKRIRFLTRDWAVRFTILNVTGNDNPSAVINNIDSPDFMKYLGAHKVSFSARLRLVG